MVHKTYHSKAVFVKLRSILKHNEFVKISHETALTSRLGDPRLNCFNAAGRQCLYWGNRRSMTWIFAIAGNDYYVPAIFCLWSCPLPSISAKDALSSTWPICNQFLVVSHLHTTSTYPWHFAGLLSMQQLLAAPFCIFFQTYVV